MASDGMAAEEISDEGRVLIRFYTY